jgi:hypothetical protein
MHGGEHLGDTDRLRDGDDGDVVHGSPAQGQDRFHALENLRTALGDEVGI